MSRLAVTGASGFVGRALVSEAGRRRAEAVGITRSEKGAAFIAGLGGRPAVVPGLEPGPLAEAFTGADAVVHLAMIGREREGENYEAVNVRGTRAVVEAARRARVPRVVLFSGLGVAHYGMTRRCTNPYFLSKLAAELELFRSGRAAVVFRPSYIVGPGDGLVTGLLGEMAGGEVARIGDGSYRMQPLAVADAAAAALAVAEAPAPGSGAAPRVFDLVGPEAVTFRSFIDRTAAAARGAGRPVEFRVREVPVDEADRAAAAGGFRGLGPDELDCLLCDEVSDAEPLRRLLGRPLASLDEALAGAVRGTPGRP
jgi:nucleoside-diphosphate-sugar epimerase